MPEYEYRNNTTGEVRSIVQRMTDEHPEAVTFNDAGHWSPAVPNDPLAWNRVWDAPTLDTGPIRNKYPYVARQIPKAHQLGYTGKTDRYGGIVVMSKQHEREICARHGIARMED